VTRPAQLVLVVAAGVLTGLAGAVGGPVAAAGPAGVAPRADGGVDAGAPDAGPIADGGTARADALVSDGGTGYDLRYLDQQRALAFRIYESVVEVDAVVIPPPPYDPESPLVYDGGGTVVAPGVLLTSDDWLAPAAKIRVMRHDGVKVPAWRLAHDPRRHLVLLGFDPKTAPGLVTVAGVAKVPAPVNDAPAAQVVMPTTLIGQAPGIRLAAALRDGPELFLSGDAGNGVPAFDTAGRLVALARRPVPSRTRSAGIDGATIRAFLEAALAPAMARRAVAAPAPDGKKPAPAPKHGGRGP